QLESLCDLPDTSVRRFNRRGHQYSVDIPNRRHGTDGVDVGDLVDRERPPVIIPYIGHIEPITKFDSGLW
ncbi:MAG: hypothetical protein VW683_14565, partial [Betaproteobacteria bacterium]